MGDNAAEQYDRIFAEKCKKIGRVWEILDERLARRMEMDEMDTVRISVKVRGGGYLLVIDGNIAGKKMVQFRDLGSLADLGGAVKAALEDPTWKESKPYGENRTKVNT